MTTRGNSGSFNGFIDKGSHVRGDLTFDDGFRIEGRFDGKIRSTGELVIGEAAEVSADVDVARLSVNGSLKGNVRAGERVELLSKAKVFADVTTPVLRIEEGAMFQGSCQMGEEPVSNLIELPFPRQS